MNNIADVFNGDAFSVVSLTDAINKIPFVPGRAGTIVNWAERGIDTTTVMLEEQDGELKFVNPTPRGGPGETASTSNRKARILRVPHYQVDDYISAESVQNVRAFGQTSQLEVLQDRVNERLQQHVGWKLDPTLELQRLGALKGVILNADGTTLYNLFTEFGVSQESEIDFDLDNATPASGALRKACAGACRKIADNLPGVPFAGVGGLAGDAFFDELIAHVEVVESYKGTSMAQVLREGYITPSGLIYSAFEFGGIVFENYRGKNGATSLVDTNAVHLFPTGVSGLYRTVFAPADYEETVNTMGLPRYAKQWATPNGKGRHLEVQMNALSYCTRPKALMKGKRT